MVSKLAITRGRVRKLIRVRELAASHKLEQMRRVRMLEKQVAWKREGGFDRIEVTAETHKQTLRRLHARFDPEYFYTEMYNPRRPSTPEEVASLRLNVLLLQLPPPLQYDLSPRRPPAAGTGLDKPGVPHPEIQQTEQEGTFPFQAGVDDVLHIDRMRIP